ncbi:YggS family pyridoxal phosphate-dependent enzyme [Photorhabdus laumondii subsp. laumondii]|uniref:Pyridoxal phosphate homeostasis protein n=3 Tax=Enterobacterales TaxID=91347 RepID=Q7N7G9_PHOLL|nr:MULTISPECIES: YggS family pyridoxal phosphate-dependent enzyme [Photorhabdus]AWK41070.1 YggS family pyridoxal phosphate enzyme [Photorhabdus laumondii subsp. laumondii]AXG41810.1 YggS family pyridoxal phosphate-dependent enzyme [Photorhabdus laumondii subsp. laumondii]AXG46398.1 YggS family pyridoxal phosphate-dependent enzyme [Photorhabdus laumondii subsp. laumondii]KTL62418.1 YggS family pyridoxal phosphate enzyme [Photorhabdus laumondii subsp. laumondii]MCC8383113.1 YggS family pyridoxal
MNNIEQNLQDVRTHIAIAAQKCERAPEEITLLAVSKTKPVEDIEKAIAAGQRQFGENYVQEGVEKIAYFANCNDLIWHFIGPLQSNKSRLVAENFNWCHTIDRLKIAQRLNEQRPEGMEPLNILIQINISDERSKSGIQLDELSTLAAEMNKLPNVRLRGLMAIPAPEPDYAHQLAVFRRMEQAFLNLKTKYPQIDTLSMGMTDDMAAAINCGSTLVRIGTAIFGARQYHN